MKLGNLLFSFLFFLILIFGSLFFYSSNYTEDSYFNQEVENNLANLANTRVERINNYFDERKKDLSFISESDKIKDLFKQNTEIIESLAVNDVNYHSKVIFKEVENFLKVHPKMTLKELQESNEFKTLAIQSLGNQGYSAIAGDSNIILFHKYDSFIGKNLFALGNPEALNLVNLARITGESQGFFNWTDPDNITRKKYGKLIRIPPEIFNESILIIVVTSYTEDYKELNNVSLETQNVLTQSIESENTDRCFGMENITGHVGHTPVDIFLNYNGDNVLGAHDEILDSNWCLLAEIEIQEIFDIPKAEKEFSDNIFLFLLISSLLILSLIIQIYFNKFVIMKKKNFISGYSLIDNLFLKLKNFFIKFKLWQSFLIVLIFAIFYFFISASFFNGWQNAKFYDDIPDLLVIIVSFIILIYSFRIDKFKSRNFIQFGSLFLLLQRLLEIPLQEYQAIVGTLSLFIWIPVIFLGYLGILFILLGFKEVVK